MEPHPFEKFKRAIHAIVSGSYVSDAIVKEIMGPTGRDRLKKGLYFGILAEVSETLCNGTSTELSPEEKAYLEALELPHSKETIKKNSNIERIRATQLVDFLTKMAALCAAKDQRTRNFPFATALIHLLYVLVLDNKPKKKVGMVKVESLASDLGLIDIVGSQPTVSHKAGAVLKDVKATKDAYRAKVWKAVLKACLVWLTEDQQEQVVRNMFSGLQNLERVLESVSDPTSTTVDDLLYLNQFIGKQMEEMEDVSAEDTEVLEEKKKGILMLHEKLGLAIKRYGNTSNQLDTKIANTPPATDDQAKATAQTAPMPDCTVQDSSSRPNEEPGIVSKLYQSENCFTLQSYGNTSNQLDTKTANLKIVTPATDDQAKATSETAPMPDCTVQDSSSRPNKEPGIVSKLYQSEKCFTLQKLLSMPGLVFKGSVSIEATIPPVKSARDISKLCQKDKRQRDKYQFALYLKDGQTTVNVIVSNDVGKQLFAMPAEQAKGNGANLAFNVLKDRRKLDVQVRGFQTQGKWFYILKSVARTTTSLSNNPSTGPTIALFPAQETQINDSSVASSSAHAVYEDGRENVYPPASKKRKAQIEVTQRDNLKKPKEAAAYAVPTDPAFAALAEELMVTVGSLLADPDEQDNLISFLLADRREDLIRCMAADPDALEGMIHHLATDRHGHEALIENVLEPCVIGKVLVRQRLLATVVEGTSQLVRSLVTDCNGREHLTGYLSCYGDADKALALNFVEAAARKAQGTIIPMTNEKLINAVSSVTAQLFRSLLDDSNGRQKLDWKINQLMGKR